MPDAAWIVGALGLLLNVGTLLVGYGVLRGTVTAVRERVAALESEMSALSELKVTVVEVKTTVSFMHEQFKELNASIRWMRKPADYEPEMPRGARGTPRGGDL